MANVYTMKVIYDGCENKIWRDIQISSNSYLCTLGYTILATFDTLAYHLFYISYNGRKYMLPTEDDYVEASECLFTVKLSDLNLKIGDRLEMLYDFGCDQMFLIEVTDITPMAKGTGRAYPKIIDGDGLGIIDDLSSDELLSVIHDIEKYDNSLFYYEAKGYQIPWDYRRYNLRIDNSLLKGSIDEIADGYSTFMAYLTF